METKQCKCQWVEGRLDNLSVTLDKFESTLNSIDKTLIRQEESLKEHMRRTELAEASINQLKADLKPVEEHVNGIKAFVRIFAAMGIIIGTVTAILKLLDKI